MDVRRRASPLHGRRLLCTFELFGLAVYCVTTTMHTVGVISDTHGLLRPEALAALAGSDYIIHAGDIGDATVLQRLRSVAPVTVVRGNNDKGHWAVDIPETAVLAVDGALFYVLHIVEQLDLDPRAAGFH